MPSRSSVLESSSSETVTSPEGSSSFRLTGPAQSDLIELSDYLAAEDPGAALRLLSELEKGLRTLAGMPGIGHLRDDLISAPDLRFWSIQNYMVVYRIDTIPLEVIRILHGNRNAARELKLGD